MWRKITQFYEIERFLSFSVSNRAGEGQYAEDLVSSIEKILSKKVEEHQQKLKNAKIFAYEVDFTSFKEISEEMVKECEKKLILLNETIEKLNALLNQKNDNVYEPISIEPVEAKRKYDECIDVLAKLEDLRRDFNKKATETEPFIIRLKEINNEIAHYDIEQLYKLYRKKINEKKEEGAKLLRLKADRDTWKKQIDALEQEKKNAKIAMKAINDDLAYIFFSKHRLRIEVEKEQYILYSHERAVEPNNVSVGERNAIGLCYFFNRIMESKDEAEVFKQAYLLVIDDPVSSFDMENRIGILSYLKYKFGQFLNGNDDSRFLVMTHDLQLFYDARQFMGELLSKSYNISAQKAFTYIRELELDNKSVNITHLCDRSEYTALFEKVYDYALRIEPEYSMNIGNIMRKIMEAFGTFVYKKGMSELSTDEKILSSLKQEDRIYFENLMYRLVLNTGSHMKEKSQTIDDMKFFDYISETDKQRTAKDIICFLYKLNSLHVMAHLKNREYAENKIQEWCAAIS